MLRAAAAAAAVAMVAMAAVWHIQRADPAPEAIRNASGTVLTASALEWYDGSGGRPIYLGILGDVFDVSTGQQHYAVGQAYRHFAGRDASRAFVTGGSTGAVLTDDTSGLSDDELESLAEWHRFFVDHETYTRVGKVVGRWYDEAGAPLEVFPFERLEERARHAADQKKQMPGCNSRFTAAEGGEVWCSPKSGGVEREWAGVPRKLVEVKVGDDPSERTKYVRCACVQPTRPPPRGFQLEVYPDCAPEAERCRATPPKK